VQYDIGSDERTSTAVVRAVSAVDGRTPETLPPLAERLDPGALNTLFDTESGGSAPTDRQLSFRYADCHITVYNGDYLCLTPAASDSDVDAERDRTARSN